MSQLVTAKRRALTVVEAEELVGHLRGLSLSRQLPPTAVPSLVDRAQATVLPRGAYGEPRTASCTAEPFQLPSISPR